MDGETRNKILIEIRTEMSGVGRDVGEVVSILRRMDENVLAISKNLAAAGSTGSTAMRTLAFSTSGAVSETQKLTSATNVAEAATENLMARGSAMSRDYRAHIRALADESRKAANEARQAQSEANQAVRLRTGTLGEYSGVRRGESQVDIGSAQYESRLSKQSMYEGLFGAGGKQDQSQSSQASARIAVERRHAQAISAIHEQEGERLLLKNKQDGAEYSAIQEMKVAAAKKAASQRAAIHEQEGERLKLTNKQDGAQYASMMQERSLVARYWEREIAKDTALRQRRDVDDNRLAGGRTAIEQRRDVDMMRVDAGKARAIRSEEVAEGSGRIALMSRERHAETEEGANRIAMMRRQAQEARAIRREEMAEGSGRVSVERRLLAEQMKEGNDRVALMRRQAQEARQHGTPTGTGTVTPGTPERGVAGEIVHDIGKVAMWTVATTAIFGTLAAARQAVATFAEFETATVNLARAGTHFGKNMTEQREGARQVADGLMQLKIQYGETGDSAFKAATQFARMGQDQQGVLTSTKAAIVMSRLTGETVEETATHLAATMGHFKLSANEAMGVVDQLNYMQNTTRTSADQLLQAVSRTGFVWQEAGGNLQSLIASVGVVQQVTGRSGSEVGNAFKTIAQRLGEATTQEVLYREAGIDIVNTSGEMMPIMDILEKLAKKWESLTTIQRANIDDRVAGVKQQNVLMAELQRMDEIRNKEKEALTQNGKAAQDAADYVATLASEWERVKAVMEWIAASPTGFGKTVANALGGVADLAAMPQQHEEQLNKYGNALGGVFSGAVSKESLNEMVNASELSKLAQEREKIVDDQTKYDKDSTDDMVRYRETKFIEVERKIASIRNAIYNERPIVDVSEEEYTDDTTQGLGAITARIKDLIKERHSREDFDLSSMLKTPDALNEKYAITERHLKSINEQIELMKATSKDFTKLSQTPAWKDADTEKKQVEAELKNIRKDQVQLGSKDFDVYLSGMRKTIEAQAKLDAHKGESAVEANKNEREMLLKEKNALEHKSFDNPAADAERKVELYRIEIELKKNLAGVEAARLTDQYKAEESQKRKLDMLQRELGMMSDEDLLKTRILMGEMKRGEIPKEMPANQFLGLGQDERRNLNRIPGFNVTGLKDMLGSGLSPEETGGSVNAPAAQRKKKARELYFGGNGLPYTGGPQHLPHEESAVAPRHMTIEEEAERHERNADIVARVMARQGGTSGRQYRTDPSHAADPRLQYKQMHDFMEKRGWEDNETPVKPPQAPPRIPISLGGSGSNDTHNLAVAITRELMAGTLNVREVNRDIKVPTMRPAGTATSRRA